MEKSHANRLQFETSPYLLQHAHNPVDWYPWGPEALGVAQRQDKPILLSIGYSACHWCHVMERESFENGAIAALMNQHFVCIKVDREERPDLDAIYMSATVAMNEGRGGWPMTVFLTPSQQPFFAGTYFPPDDRHGMPGFGRLLTHIAQLWQQERQALLKQGQQIAAALQHDAPGGAGSLTEAVWPRLLGHLRDDFDATYGGFGPAPKFPHATTLSVLLRWAQTHKDAQAQHMVRKTLDGMATGGIYDHIGGGFARYSTDAAWRVPHFEKMLYDNALLAKTYCEAFATLGNPDDARVARETLIAMQRDMQSPEGGFYSAIDADSEGVEGKFYVWRPSQLAAILGGELARIVGAYYDITEAGNWEGQSVACTPRPAAEVALELGIDAETLQQCIDRARPLLFAARAQRPAPACDDKILTAWNGLMIGAMATGARTLAAPAFLHAAGRAADFILGQLRQSDGRLLRTYRAGKAHLAGYLEDYAYLSEGLVDLYEAGASAAYLHAAEALAKIMVADFWDASQGVFFSTAHQHEALLMRPRDGFDGATPNPHATAAAVLARLAIHFERPAWEDLAGRAVVAYGAQASRSPWAFCKTLQAWQFLQAPPPVWVLVHDGANLQNQAIWQAMQRRHAMPRVVAHGKPDELPLTGNRPLLGGRATLYICHDHTCAAPLTNPQALPSDG